MAAEPERRFRRRTWQLLRRQVQALVVSCIALAVLTGLMACLHFCAWGDDLLAGISGSLVAQVVPATVIAIFVFAVGVAFVVAQVVPPTRGTRADGELRDLRLEATIAPAPAFILGSAVLVTYEGFDELAAALLVGSVLYIAGSVVCMLSILSDATDPCEFKDLLLRRGIKATGRGREDTRAGGLADTYENAWRFVAAPRNPKDTANNVWFANDQRAADSLYAIVRTFRGWARVSASTGDSRELHESLDGLLRLVDWYSRVTLPRVHGIGVVPETHWRHVGDALELSPLYNRGNAPTHPTSASRREWPSWADPWAPPLMTAYTVPSEIAQKLTEDEIARLRTLEAPHAFQAAYYSLPSTWFANEIGRSIVRAVEFGTDAHGLLERDISRLLNTLENAAIMFFDGAIRAAEGVRQPGLTPCPSHEWSVGVMLKYLVEIGLGARRCPSDRIEWYYEPCVRLVRLHHRFRRAGPDGGDSVVDEAAGGSCRRLSVGAAAGVIRVCEAILAAQERAGPTQTRYMRLQRMTRVLGATQGAGDAVLDLDEAGRKDAKQLARAEAGPLASNDHREIHPADPNRLGPILAALEKHGSRQT